MYAHLLVATDGSEISRKAVEQGLALGKALGAKVTVITVSEPIASLGAGEAMVSFPIEEYDKNVSAAANAILAQVGEMARAAGAACSTLHIKDRYPADGIVETAERLKCDLIVMASHGRRGLSRMLLGSQANRVVTHSAIPVLICR